MREKNVRRAAHALYMSQADDKNAILSRYVKNSAQDARSLVEDQGRALVLLEKLVLPHGKDSFTEEEMYAILMKKLKKKGHRIQENEEEDTPQYAKEKEKWENARRAQVPSLFGVTLDQLEKLPTPSVGSKPPLPTDTSKYRGRSVAVHETGNVKRITFWDRVKFFFGRKEL